VVDPLEYCKRKDSKDRKEGRKENEVRGQPLWNAKRLGRDLTK